jgi:hypothetical protein
MSDVTGPDVANGTRQSAFASGSFTELAAFPRFREKSKQVAQSDGTSGSRGPASPGSGTS